MNKNGLECDIYKVFSAFKELSADEMGRAVRRALISGAKEIRDKTKEKARVGIKNTNTHPNDKYHSDTIFDAPRFTKVEDRYDGEMNIRVHVMGTQASGSQTYRFRFLEKGTKDRYQQTYTDSAGKKCKLTKPRYIGSIKPRRFFADAVDETNLQQIYVEEISKAINNINNKK